MGSDAGLSGSTGNGAATPLDDLITDTTTQTFTSDVLEASMQVPVLVDFWAPWCGPCKQLTPILEKLVRAARGAVKLVKMNIDDYPEVAGQLRVQSIPAVFAFKKGQPVDGFMGALPESQLRAFIEKLVGEVGPSPAEELTAAGVDALDHKELGQAAQFFAQALQAEPGLPAAIAGLARCYIESGDLDRAKQTLALVRPDGKNDALIIAAQAALSLAEKAAELGDTSEFMQRLEANKKDHEARFNLAIALNAKGDKEGAVDQLLLLFEYDRKWNDEAARKQLVEFFNAYGPKDEVTLSGRRRLSSLMFS